MCNYAPLSVARCQGRLTVRGYSKGAVMKTRMRVISGSVAVGATLILTGTAANAMTLGGTASHVASIQSVAGPDNDNGNGNCGNNCGGGSGGGWGNGNGCGNNCGGNGCGNYCGGGGGGGNGCGNYNCSPPPTKKPCPTPTPTPC